MTERITKDDGNQERNAGLVKPYCFTFGSSENFPYQGGHVEVQAASREEAIQLFRSHYPDRNEGIVNCAFIYDQDEWNQTNMSHRSDHDCHHVITSTGPYAVSFDQGKTVDDQPLDQLIKEAKEKATRHMPDSRSTPPELER